MEPIERYVAVDGHQHYVMVAAINAAHELVLTPRKLSLERFTPWAPAHLTPKDQVVLEASVNAGTLYDQLAPLVHDVKIAHALRSKRISAARVKTDTRDPRHLARLLSWPWDSFLRSGCPLPRDVSGGCCSPIVSGAYANAPKRPIGCTACGLPARSRRRPVGWAAVSR